MKVLITGHRGFVGRHLVAALEVDHDLFGIDVKATPGGYQDCRDFFREDRRVGHFDLVLHCAAVVGGRATIEGEPMKVATDLAIDSDLFQWALRCRPGRVVYFSSSAAYPARYQREGCTLPLVEDDIDPTFAQEPDAIYGWVKLTGERLAAHARAEGLPVTVLRPFSGYGSDQDLDYPFPSLIDRALRREDPFTVWGPGTQVRDWVHIDDVVGATLAAVEQGVDGPVNICSGVGTSFVALAQQVCRAAGYEPVVEPQPDKPYGVHHRVGDPTLMRTFYEPQVSLEQGIARALAQRQIGAAA